MNLLWDRYCRNSISTSCQGTESSAFDVCRSKKQFCASYSKIAIVPWVPILYSCEPNPLLCLSGLPLNLVFFLFCLVFCFFLTFSQSVAYIVFACTCPCASGAHYLSNGVLRIEAVREGKCSLEQIPTFKRPLPNALVQQAGSHLMRIFYIPLQAAAHCTLALHFSLQWENF